MSANTSPSHYTEDAFVSDANFKVEINQKMKVPDKISFSNESNGEIRNSWTKDNFDMQVPERILVMGQHQHVGTRAPPREIVYDNSILASDPYPKDLPRVATPPRTLTLDKYQFPGVNDYESDLETEEEKLPVAKPRKVNKPNTDESLYSLSNSFREGTPPLGGAGEGLTPAEEVLHLRRQMAKLNRRVMALEMENLNRLQKEKLLVQENNTYIFSSETPIPNEL